jgi:hypothetical protein
MIGSDNEVKPEFSLALPTMVERLLCYSVIGALCRSKYEPLLRAYQVLLP